MTRYSLVVPPNSPGARALAELQPLIRRKFWEHVERLCADPLNESQRAKFLGMTVQVFRFQVDIEPSIYFFNVMFKYADTLDENTLIVSDILIKET